MWSLVLFYCQNDIFRAEIHCEAGIFSIHPFRCYLLTHNHIFHYIGAINTRADRTKLLGNRHPKGSIKKKMMKTTNWEWKLLRIALPVPRVQHFDGQQETRADRFQDFWLAAECFASVNHRSLLVSNQSPLRSLSVRNQSGLPAGRGSGEEMRIRLFCSVSTTRGQQLHRLANLSKLTFTTFVATSQFWWTKSVLCSGQGSSPNHLYKPDREP